jgi:aromatic-amino-acid transaminase
MFDHIGAHAGDPILGLNEDFQNDTRPGKTNLGIGVYLDDSGTLPLMAAVAQAEAELQSRAGARSYLPMAGLAAYRDALQALVFGPGHAARAEGRIATIQSLGGSGALRVGGDFLKQHFPGAGVWVSDPSWENHRVVFEAAGSASAPTRTATRPPAACASMPCATPSAGCRRAASCCCMPAATTPRAWTSRRRNGAPLPR